MWSHWNRCCMIFEHIVYSWVFICIVLPNLKKYSALMKVDMTIFSTYISFKFRVKHWTCALRYVGPLLLPLNLLCLTEVPCNLPNILFGTFEKMIRINFRFFRFCFRLSYPLFLLLFILFLSDVYLSLMSSFQDQVRIIIGNGTIYASRNVQQGTNKMQLLARKPVTIPKFRYSQDCWKAEWLLKVAWVGFLPVAECPGHRTHI